MFSVSAAKENRYLRRKRFGVSCALKGSRRLPYASPIFPLLARLCSYGILFPKEGDMKLSKDQIRIAKSTTLYAVAIIVLLPIVRHLMGTPFCWGDALVSAGAIILGALIIGVLLIIGSSKPSRNKE